MKVYLVDKPSFIYSEFDRFLNDNDLTWNKTKDSSDSEKLVEVAGRLCYMSFGVRQSPRTNKEYIINLIDKGHDSVLEHATWSFILTGVSRGFSHQLVRHRVGFSYSQLSQQYFRETSAKFVIPSIIKNNEELLKIWNESNTKSLNSYKQILEILNGENINNLNAKETNRLKNSAARTNLPNATETKIFVTANARSLRHFLKQRGSIMGDEEMRLVSAELLKVLKKEAPSLFFDFKTIVDEDDNLPLVIHEQ